MKFDAHVSNVGFILYLVARLFQSLRKQIRVLSHVFYIPIPQLPLRYAEGLASGYIIMNNYLLLIGISCIPAVAGMLVTLPLWYSKHLRNRTIHILGLLILFLTLICTLLPTVTGECTGIGFAAIAVSCINFFLFRHYERLLYTLRCPGCRRVTLRIRAVHHKTYRLHCKRCGLYTDWRE